MTRRLGFIYDNENPRSLSSFLRRRRLRILQEMISSVPGQVTILDLGGSAGFWKRSGLLDDPATDVLVTLVNLDARVETADLGPGLLGKRGDACRLPEFGDRSFDIVVSNSVIEHVGGTSKRSDMASEIHRLAPRYFVQTPNRYFPVEPHFLVPFFQFLPLRTRAWLVRHAKLGWMPKCDDRKRSLEAVAGVELIGAGEMRRLFPDAQLKRERILLTKSLIAVKS